MPGPAVLPDPVDAAIAAAETPTAIRMRRHQITISSTGRPAVLVIPADAADGEVAELAGWMLTALLAALREERTSAPGPRLFVPG